LGGFFGVRGFITALPLASSVKRINQSGDESPHSKESSQEPDAHPLPRFPLFACSGARVCLHSSQANLRAWSRAGLWRQWRFRFAILLAGPHGQQPGLSWLASSSHPVPCGRNAAGTLRSGDPPWPMPAPQPSLPRSRRRTNRSLPRHPSAPPALVPFAPDSRRMCRRLCNRRYRRAPSNGAASAPSCRTNPPARSLAPSTPHWRIRSSTLRGSIIHLATPRNQGSAGIARATAALPGKHTRAYPRAAGPRKPTLALAVVPEDARPSLGGTPARRDSGSRALPSRGPPRSRNRSAYAGARTIPKEPASAQSPFMDLGLGP
jgi:hypothetical protein